MGGKKYLLLRLNACFSEWQSGLRVICFGCALLYSGRYCLTVDLATGILLYFAVTHMSLCSDFTDALFNPTKGSEKTSKTPKEVTKICEGDLHSRRNCRNFKHGAFVCMFAGVRDSFLKTPCYTHFRFLFVYSHD